MHDAVGGPGRQRGRRPDDRSAARRRWLYQHLLEGEAENTDEEGDGVRRRAWSCGGDSVIELITIADHGHPWPGSPPQTVESVNQGPMTDKTSATEELERFVSDLDR